VSYLKKEIWTILEKENIENIFKYLENFSPTKVVSFLIGAFLHPIEEARWKAIIAFGHIVSQIAKLDLEKARIVIRRLIWMLNEESGSMAWGVPEGFAESLYHNETLKNEYLSIFVSYIWNPEDKTKYKADNYLEFPPAQRGVIWGIGRLAQKYKSNLIEKKAHVYVYQHLFSKDLPVKFLSLWTLNNLYPFPKDLKIEYPEIKKLIESLKSLNFKYLMFDGKNILYKNIYELEKELTFL